MNNNLPEMLLFFPPSVHTFRRSWWILFLWTNFKIQFSGSHQLLIHPGSQWQSCCITPRNPGYISEPGWSPAMHSLYKSPAPITITLAHNRALEICSIKWQKYIRITDDLFLNFLVCQCSSTSNLKPSYDATLWHLTERARKSSALLIEIRPLGTA